MLSTEDRGKGLDVTQMRLLLVLFLHVQVLIQSLREEKDGSRAEPRG